MHDGESEQTFMTAGRHRRLSKSATTRKSPRLFLDSSPKSVLPREMFPGMPSTSHEASARVFPAVKGAADVPTNSNQNEQPNSGSTSADSSEPVINKQPQLQERKVWTRSRSRALSNNRMKHDLHRAMAHHLEKNKVTEARYHKRRLSSKNLVRIHSPINQRMGNWFYWFISSVPTVRFENTVSSRVSGRDFEKRNRKYYWAKMVLMLCLLIAWITDCVLENSCTRTYRPGHSPHIDIFKNVLSERDRRRTRKSAKNADQISESAFFVLV